MREMNADLGEDLLVGQQLLSGQAGCLEQVGESIVSGRKDGRHQIRIRQCFRQPSCLQAQQQSANGCTPRYPVIYNN